MFRFNRLACLICAAGIAAAPGSATERGWRTGSEAQTAARSDQRTSHGETCAASARMSAQAGRVRPSASLAPQRAQGEMRNAAAARLARLWAGRSA